MWAKKKMAIRLHAAVKISGSHSYPRAECQVAKPMHVLARERVATHRREPTICQAVQEKYSLRQ